MIDWLFDHQEQIGVVSLLICVSAYLWLRRAKKKPLNEKIISPLIVAAFSGYSIPQGFFLLYMQFRSYQTQKDGRPPALSGCRIPQRNSRWNDLGIQVRVRG